MARSLDRGWRIAWLALAWLGGVALQLQQPTLWPQQASAAVALVACGIAALSWWRGGQARFVLVVAAMALSAFASTDWRAAQRMAERLPPALEGQDIVVTGVVAELPRLSSIGTHFVFEVESATHAGAPVAVPGRLSIGWYHGYDGESLVASPPQALNAGDRWQLPLRLKQPHGLMNPHGFDLELWLFEQGIRASGYVRPGALWLADGVAHPVERLRQRIRDALLLRVADASAAGVLAALAGATRRRSSATSGTCTAAPASRIS